MTLVFSGIDLIGAGNEDSMLLLNVQFVTGGACFHPDTVLLDPYARWTETVPSQLPNAVFLGALNHLTSPMFNWQESERPRRPYEECIVSELDLLSLSLDKPLSEASKMIASMSEAGVNAVVLRGLMLSTDSEGDIHPLSFFSPDPRIFQSPNDARLLVQECHRHSIEVLLEMHFGFTGEDAINMSFKGLDARLYFRGKGILNCGHPVVQECILDALHHWTTEYRVDGFMFRHAETMTQDRDGTIQDAPAVPEAIAVDPILKKCKLVAVSGDDQLLPRGGERGFPHWGCWTEYNSRFQFDFWDFLVNGKPARLSNIATRITGSADVFGACWDGGFPGSLAAGRRPAFGFNSPVPSFKSLKTALDADRSLAPDRSETLMRSLLTAAVMSQGVPVVPVDCWSDPNVRSFLKRLLKFRMEYLDLIQPDAFDAVRNIEWHSPVADRQPEWDGGPKSHFIGYSIRDADRRGFFVGFNGFRTDIDVRLPSANPGDAWRCVIDTRQAKDIGTSASSTCSMSAGSAVVFELVAEVDSTAAEIVPEL